MLRFRFLDADTNNVIADTPAISLKLRLALNESVEWDASFPRNTEALTQIAEGNDVEIYYKGQLILDGSVQTFSNKLDNDSESLSLQGRNRLDDLFLYRANSQAYYQAQPMLLILGELLRRAGWRLGDISTIPDKEIISTVDLRSEKRLMAQIATYIKGVSTVNFRYGGLVVGKHALDVGAFGRNSGVMLYKPPDADIIQEFDLLTGVIESIDIKTTLNEIINSVEVLGGDAEVSAGVTRAINLGDAIAGNASLTDDPDFPIEVEIANFVWVIRNNNIPLTRGSQSLERYTQYAPEKSGGVASAAAVQGAGLALYERGRSFLIDHQNNIVEISIKASGENLFVGLGDNVYIKGTYQTQIINTFTDEVEITTTEIAGFYRVVSLNVNFDNDDINWDFQVTNGPTFKNEELFVSIFDAAKNPDPPTGAVFVPAFAPQKVAATVTQSGGAADTVLNDGVTTAKLVTLPIPAPPGSATDVYLAGIPYPDELAGVSYAVTNQDNIIDMKDARISQSFTMPDETRKINSISVMLDRTGAPAGNIWVDIYDDDDGVPGNFLFRSRTNLSAASISTSITLYPFFFPPPYPTLERNKKYHIVVANNGTGWVIPTDRVTIGTDTSSPSFDGEMYSRADSASVWSLQTGDMIFEIKFIDETLLVELVSDPIFSPLTGAVVKVARKGSGWNSAFEARLVGHYVWI